MKGVRREPDAVRWLDNDRFVTANEGDWKGGSRGFTIFRKDGTVEFDAGNMVDHIAIRLGHYPERRSAAKGSEPEGLEVGTYDGERLFFVGLERASLVLVFKDEGPGKAPRNLQALPGGIAPEGLLAIPQRNLFVSASEADLGEKDGPRSAVTIYQRSEAPTAYPTIVSADVDGVPLGWGALSGLAAHPELPGRLFSVADNAYTPSRILEIDATKKPATITGAITVTKDGKPASYDLEGIATRPGGGFWLASEGAPERKEKPTQNLLLRASAKGEIEEEIALPEEFAAKAANQGYEGVAVTGAGQDGVFRHKGLEEALGKSLTVNIGNPSSICRHFGKSAGGMGLRKSTWQAFAASSVAGRLMTTRSWLTVFPSNLASPPSKGSAP